MPTKEQIRVWLADTVKSKEPPPSPERIREMLGWKLVQKARAAS